VLFLRSPSGDNPATALWCYDTEAGVERELASAAGLLQDGEENLPAEERARRERSRELAGGIVGYACDDAVEHAAFALDGRLWWVGTSGSGEAGPPRQLAAPPGVFAPRPSPDGRYVGFLAGNRLCCVATDGSADWEVLAQEGQDVSWGAAEFIAAEEMGRLRGFWWGPGSGEMLAARVDESGVATWWTADPASPAAPPVAHRYPAAGTPDAEVTLWWLPVGSPGDRREVVWDRATYPYLVAVNWAAEGPPLLLVERRDHKACIVLAADPSTGATREVAGMSSPKWVQWPAGLPAWHSGGALLWAAEDAGTWRLTLDGRAITPEGLQVREVSSVGDAVVFSASQEPEVVEAWEWSPDGGTRRLSDVGGVCAAMGAGPVRVVAARSLDWHGVRVQVRREGSEPVLLRNLARQPGITPHVRLLRVGERRLSVGVVLPSGHPGGKLPVVMAPYGGPGHQLVMAARSVWLEAQWTAEQGFAVVVADGRGTPGRGPDFERAVYRDLAGPVLEDQVAALHGAAELVPELDLGRVGIKGWSFGGYLAALAVLARPDVFHAAIAGAPVTDWRYYDTYYTERYMGLPEEEPEAYARTSLLGLAAGSRRPLMLVHGLADDNVYAKHTLALSGALFTAHRPHHVLPLPGVSHVAAGEDVAESLLLNGAQFFREALAAPEPLAT
jgi:dipeptidyl-peptidase-4